MLQLLKMHAPFGNSLHRAGRIFLPAVPVYKPRIKFPTGPHLYLFDLPIRPYTLREYSTFMGKHTDYGLFLWLL